MRHEAAYSFGLGSVQGIEPWMGNHFRSPSLYHSVRLKEFLLDRPMSFKVHDEVFEIRPVPGPGRVEGVFAEIFFEGERTLVRTLRGGAEAYGGRRYRMITFLDELPMDLVGFLACVSSALADRGLPIFVLSSFRTDHVLLLEEDLPQGIDALESLGFVLGR